MNIPPNTDTSNLGFLTDPIFSPQTQFVHIEEIPSCGFNQLFTAERFGKKWFLKGLKAEYREQPLYRELLRKELDILMSLNYPYIVQAFALEQIPQIGTCIIMEYVDGITLKKYIEKGISKPLKIKIIFQILEALNYIHEKQIVHRDLKPSNILITHNGGNVKLIDFGLADSDAYRIFKQPAGTLRYMSPEQYDGRQPDIKNDIYSMGRILEDLRMGPLYNKIIRKCLSPAQHRYADTNHLAKAIQNVQQLTSKAFKIVLICFILFLLGYLTLQVRAIKMDIPTDNQQTASINDSSLLLT